MKIDRQKILERVIKLNESFQTKSTALWENLLERLSPKDKNDFKYQYLSEADRIDQQPIARGAPLALYASLAFLGLVLLWSIFAELDKVVVARGRLLSTEPNIVLQLQDTGQITGFNISVGQKVKEGEVLLTIDPTISEAERVQIEERFESVSKQLDGLLREQRSLKQALEAPSRAILDASGNTKYQDNASKLRESLALSSGEIRSLENRLKHAQELEKMHEQLFEKKFQSKKNFLDATDKRLEVEQALLSAKNRENGIRRELNSLLAAMRDEITTLTRERDTLKQQLVKAQKRSEQIALAAPRNAVVLEIAKLSVGSVARATEPLITLVPLDTPMTVEAQVPASDISGVFVGQDAKVKIDTYPFQRYGYLRGKLSAVSPDTIESPSADGGVQRVYVVRVEITDWNFNGAQKPGSILPGMTLNAEIIVGSRRVIEYLLDPISRISDEALTEN